MSQEINLVSNSFESVMKSSKAKNFSFESFSNLVKQKNSLKVKRIFYKTVSTTI